MTDTGPYSVGEKVLVPHTDKYYEAKVLKASLREDGLWYYSLHYTGWNKKWDEWVEETGLIKAPQDGGPIPSSKKGGAKGSTQAAKKPTDGAAAPALQLSLAIPAPLKKQLLDDHDAIVENGKLLPLPRSPTVAELVQQYVAHVLGRQHVADAEDDVAAGLQLYFDKALVHCLLYKGEQRQADEVLADGRIPSTVYGVEHFLRLFVKLPELLPPSSLAEDQVALLATRAEDVLRFMQLKQQQLFLPPEQYVAAAKAGGPPAKSVQQ